MGLQGSACSSLGSLRKGFSGEGGVVLTRRFYTPQRKTAVNTICRLIQDMHNSPQMPLTVSPSAEERTGGGRGPGGGVMGKDALLGPEGCSFTATFTEFRKPAHGGQRKDRWGIARKQLRSAGSASPAACLPLPTLALLWALPSSLTCITRLRVLPPAHSSCSTLGPEILLQSQSGGNSPNVPPPITGEPKSGLSIQWNIIRPSKRLRFWSSHCGSVH